MYFGFSAPALRFEVYFFPVPFSSMIDLRRHSVRILNENWTYSLEEIFLALAYTKNHLQWYQWQYYRSEYQYICTFRINSNRNSLWRETEKQELTLPWNHRLIYPLNLQKNLTHPQRDNGWVSFPINVWKNKTPHDNTTRA